MKHALIMLLAMAFAAECHALGQENPEKKPEARKPFVPTDHYVKKSVEGWVVYVNKDLLGGRKELGDRALRLLENKLFEIRRSVPPAALASLVKVPIWLGVDDGHAPCAEYHPNREWLIENGYNPDKAKGVEIGNAENFVQWSHDQPSMILHELSHAYHDQVLGFHHRGVQDAFHKAVASKGYESVLRCNGRMDRAYALSNEQEYFAEASEAYFGTNDFYPFVRAELKKHDPVGFETLHEVWDIRK
ncbi:hypothetical protein [Singulisphaera sp. PoT]|uniref:hypothetical protein n=1 Tax=Singulisphaera sp. PoT TaxID=3411797 RepID=UPI003BF5C20A